MAAQQKERFLLLLYYADYVIQCLHLQKKGSIEMNIHGFIVWALLSLNVRVRILMRCDYNNIAVYE